jgi:hypothetical protein
MQDVVLEGPGFSLPVPGARPHGAGSAVCGRLPFYNWKDHDSYQQAFQRLLRDLKAEQATKAEA